MVKAEVRAYARQRPGYQTQLGLEPNEIPYEGAMYGQTFKFVIFNEDPNAHLFHVAMLQAADEVGAELFDVHVQEDRTVFEFTRDVPQDRIIEIVGEMVAHGQR